MSMPPVHAGLSGSGERPPIRVVLAMDDAMARRELRLRLHAQRGITVVAEAAGGAAGARMSRSHGECVLVLDGDGAKRLPPEVIADVRRRSREVRVIVLTDREDSAAIGETFRAGAVGYVRKTGASGDLARAVLSAVQDRQYLTPVLGARLGATPVKGSSGGRSRARGRNAGAVTAQGPRA